MALSKKEERFQLVKDRLEFVNTSNVNAINVNVEVSPSLPGSSPLANGEADKSPFRILRAGERVFMRIDLTQGLLLWVDVRVGWTNPDTTPQFKVTRIPF